MTVIAVFYFVSSANNSIIEIDKINLDFLEWICYKNQMERILIKLLGVGDAYVKRV